MDGHVLNMPTLSVISGMSSGLAEANSKGDEVTEKERWVKALLSGGMEGFSEGLFGLLGVGGSDITDELASKLANKFSSPMMKNLASLAISAGGEALEELISYTGNYMTDNLIVNRLGETDFRSEYDWQDVGKQMAIAAISSGILGGMNASVNQHAAIQMAEERLGRKLTKEEQSQVAQALVLQALDEEERGDFDPDGEGENVTDVYCTTFSESGEVMDVAKKKGMLIENPNKKVNVVPAVVRSDLTNAFEVVDVTTGMLLDTTPYRSLEEAKKGFYHQIVNLDEASIGAVNEKMRQSILAIEMNFQENLPGAQEEFQRRRSQNAQNDVLNEEMTNYAVDDVTALKNEFNEQETYTEEELESIWNRIRENNLQVKYDETGALESYLAIEESENGLTIGQYDHQDNLIKSEPLQATNGIYKATDIQTVMESVANTDLQSSNKEELPSQAITDKSASDTIGQEVSSNTNISQKQKRNSINLTDEAIRDIVKYNNDGREIKDSNYVDFMVERYKDSKNISGIETNTKYVESLENKTKKEIIDDLYQKINEKEFKIDKDLKNENGDIEKVLLDLQITKKGLNESFNKGISKEKYAIVPYLDIAIKTSKDGIIRDEAKGRTNINDWYYLYNTAKINNELYGVKIDIKKTPQGDKFYVHRVNLVHKKGIDNQIPAVGNGTIKINSIPSNTSVPQNDENVKFAEMATDNKVLNRSSESTFYNFDKQRTRLDNREDALSLFEDKTSYSTKEIAEIYEDSIENEPEMMETNGGENYIYLEEKDESTVIIGEYEQGETNAIQSVEVKANEAGKITGAQINNAIEEMTKIIDERRPIKGQLDIEGNEVRRMKKNDGLMGSEKMDNQGRYLSDLQVKFFKNSKVRDEKGRLLTMYHGTPNGTFHIFHDGSYFTANRDYANKYQAPNASAIQFGKENVKPKTYEVYLNIENPFDLRDEKARDIYINEYIKGGNAIGINPYESDYFYHSIEKIDWTEGEDLREFLKENHPEYDGLILDEGGNPDNDGNVTYRGFSYVTFHSNQIKNIDNASPTMKDDIRYMKKSNHNGGLTKTSKNNDNVRYLKKNGGLTRTEVNDNAVRRTFEAEIESYKKASKKVNKVTGDVVEINTNVLEGVAKRKQSSFMNEYLKHEVKGHDYYVDGEKIIANGTTIGKLKNGHTNFDKRIEQNIRSELKSNIVANLESVISHSTMYQKDRPDTKDHNFANVFDRRKSMVEYKGQKYEVMFEIGKKNEMNTLYSIENIKKIGKASSGTSYNKTSKYSVKSSRTSLPNNNIAQNKGIVKDNIKKDKKNKLISSPTRTNKGSQNTDKTVDGSTKSKIIITNSNENVKAPRFAKRPKDYIKPSTKLNGERADAWIEQEIQKVEKAKSWDDTIPTTRLTDIRKTIEDYLGLGIKKGHFRQMAYGIYKGNRDVIRTKEYKDIDTILHETGHAMDLGGRLQLDKEQIADELLAAIDRLGGYEKESRTVRLEEGFAEVIREYSVVPEQAKKEFPQTITVIEELREKDKKFDEFVSKVQKQIYGYIHQNPQKREHSNMSIGEQTDKIPLTKAWVKQEVMRNVWDKDFVVKEAVKSLAEVNGKTVNELRAGDNAYYLTRLASGIGDKVTSMLADGYMDENGNQLMPGLKNIGEILGEEAQRYDDLRDYLVAKRDKEYKAKSLKTGIRDGDVEFVLEKFKNDTQIKKAAQVVYDTLDGVMQYAVQNGLISEENVESLKKSNAFYVPMQRVIERRGNQVGRRGAVTDIIKRRTGSELDIKDVLENVITNSSNVIQQVENNNILRAFYHQGEAAGLTGSVYDVIQTPLKKVGTAHLSLWESELKNQGVNVEELDLEKTIDLFVPNEKVDRQNLITSFMDDEGKRVYLQFNDEILFNSLMNMDKEFMSQVLKINSKMNMPLRYGATMANIGFAIPNMISDTAQAAIYSTAGFVPVVDNALGVLDVLMATNERVEGFVKQVFPEYAKRINQLYRIYQQSGASSSTRMSQYRKSTQERMKEIYGTRSSEVLGIQESFKPLKRLLDVLTYLPELSEQSTRFRVFERNYDYYKSKGTSEMNTRILAALEARDATQDFGRTGNVTREINQLIPFSAARVGSVYTFAEKVQANPKQVGMRIAVLTALAMMIKALGYEDKEIEELNQRKKDDNFVFRLGDSVVTIKKPQGILRSMVNLAEYIQDLATGHLEEGKEGERLGEWLKNAIMDNMPADSVTGLVPNMVAPLIENAINKDFYYHTDIVRSYDLELPDREQYYDYNSGLAILLGGVFNYSPAKIDNLISGYFGGLGTQLTSLMDDVSGKMGLSVEKPEMGAESQAIGKRFIVNVNRNSQSVDDIYERKTELMKKKNGEVITEEESEELERITGAISNMSKINKQIKEIKVSLSLSGKEKTKEIKRLQEERTDLAREALGKELIYTENADRMRLMTFYPSGSSLKYNGYELNLTTEMREEYARLASGFYDKYERQGIYGEATLKDIQVKAKDYAKKSLIQKYKEQLTRTK